MTNQKNKKKSPPQSLLYAFESFALEASERELDDALKKEGIDPEDLLAEANRSIQRALAESKEENDNNGADISLRQETLHTGLKTLVSLLRRERGLSEQQLADNSEVDVDEIKSIENDVSFEPGPRTIYQLEKYFKLEPKTLGVMSGVIKTNSAELTEGIFRFAAQSKEMGKLSKDEKKHLNDFVKFISTQLKKHGQ